MGASSVLFSDLALSTICCHYSEVSEFPGLCQALPPPEPEAPACNAAALWWAFFVGGVPGNRTLGDGIYVQRSSPASVGDRRLRLLCSVWPICFPSSRSVKEAFGLRCLSHFLYHYGTVPFFYFFSVLLMGCQEEEEVKVWWAVAVNLNLKQGDHTVNGDVILPPNAWHG